MMDSLKIGILQLDILWEDIKANQEKIEQILLEQENLPELLILPETYTTGFSMSPDKLPTKLLKEQLNWQTKLSKQYNINAIGSVITPIKDNFANRLLFTKPNGQSEFYDKRHLFHSEVESGLFKAGSDRKCFDMGKYKIMPQICYDLRFPVWSRNDLDYDILVYVANWPASRQHVWETLLPARAIENQCYVVAVNRVGEDKNKISYLGGSVVYDPFGKALLKLDDKMQYADISLAKKPLDDYRNKFPVLKDADVFKIKNPDSKLPG